MKITFARTEEMAAQLGVSSSCLKRWRSEMIPGVHFTVVNLRVTLYNIELVQDWVITRADPLAHQRAIDLYLQSLPSNRRKRG